MRSSKNHVTINYSQETSNKILISIWIVLTSLKNLTCIIGATCDEGCIIVSDRREVRGRYDSAEVSKIQLLWDQAAIAGAGTGSLSEKLAISLNNSKSKIERTAPDFEKTVERIEDIVMRLRKRYHQRMGYDYKLEAIIIGLKEFDRGDPYIRYIDSLGISEQIRTFHIIGRAKQSVAPLFAMLYDHGLTLGELAALGYFSMSAIIRLGIDLSLGASVGPDIVILRSNEKASFISPSDAQFGFVRESLKDLKFKYVLMKKVWPKMPAVYKNIDPKLLN